MKYYLVAVLDVDSYKIIEPLQRNLLKKYKLPKNSITLHIPLETLENPNIDKLDEVVTKLIKPYKKFKIELTGDVHYHDPANKTISLKIENKGYIKKIHRCLNDMLKLHGFNIKESVDSPLYIPVSYNTNGKDIKKTESSPVQFHLRTVSKRNVVTISKIELWKISNSRKETIVKSYTLRNY